MAVVARRNLLDNQGLERRRHRAVGIPFVILGGTQAQLANVEAVNHGREGHVCAARELPVHPEAVHVVGAAVEVKGDASTA